MTQLVSYILDCFWVLMSLMALSCCRHLSAIGDFKDYKEKERDLFGQTAEDMKYILARREDFMCII